MWDEWSGRCWSATDEISAVKWKPPLHVRVSRWAELPFRSSKNKLPLIPTHNPPPRLTLTHKQGGGAGKTSALRTIILSSFPISQSRERRPSGEPEPFCGGSGGNGHCPIYLIRRVELRPARRCRREESRGLAATLSQTFSSNYNNI